MVRAGILGFIAAASLVLGAGIGVALKVPKRTHGLVMGFGAGALLSAAAFELVEEAIARGGTISLTVGLASGAVVYFVATRILSRVAASRGDAGAAQASGLAITVGAAIDGLPESVILGTALIGGARVPLAFFVAVLVSNVPEGVSAAADLRRGGDARTAIVLRFLWIAVASAVAAGVGFAVFDGFGPGPLALVQSFAAGGLLTMVMDTMAPEAFDDAGPLSGLVAVAGFELAFLLSNASA